MTAQITANFSDPPLRSQPDSFAQKAEVFVSQFQPFATQANALASEVNQNALTATSAAQAAEAARTAAQSASSATAWTSGSNPSQGTVVWDTTDFRSYRRTNQTISPNTSTRPGLTTQGWVRINGDAMISGNNAFTGSNTFSQHITVPAGATGSQAPRASEVTGITSSTGSSKIAAGTSAQADGSPQVGYTRFDTTINRLMVWDGAAWTPQRGLSTAVATLTGKNSETILFPAPVWADEFEVVISSASFGTSANRCIYIRLITESEVSSGYESTSTLVAGTSAGEVDASTAFVIYANNTQTGRLVSGSLKIHRIGTDYVAGGVFRLGSSSVAHSAGRVVASGRVTGIRVATGTFNPNTAGGASGTSSLNTTTLYTSGQFAVYAR